MSKQFALQKLGFISNCDPELKNHKQNELNPLIKNIIILYYEFLKHLTIRDLIILSRTCSNLRNFLFNEKCCFYDSIKTNYPAIIDIFGEMQQSGKFKDQIFNITGSLVPYLLYGRFPIRKNILNPIYSLPNDIDLIITYKNNKIKNNEKIINPAMNGSYFESKTMIGCASKENISNFMKKIYNCELFLSKNHLDIIGLKKHITIFDHFNTYDLSCCKNLMICNIDKQEIDFIFHKDTMKGTFKIYDTDNLSIDRIQKYTRRGFIPKKKKITYSDWLDNKYNYEYDPKCNYMVKKNKIENL